MDAPLSGTVDQSTDNSVGKRTNDALPWCVLAALFGGLGFGGLVVLCLLVPWRAQGELSEAKMRAEFAQAIAKAQEQAAAAAVVSDVWRNRVNKLEAEANANRRR